MAIKAVLVDFFGTLVREDEGRLKDICRQVCETSSLYVTPGEVAVYWWQRLDEYASACWGVDFRPERELELRALEDVVGHFRSRLAARDLAARMRERWRKPEAWHDGRLFMSRLPLAACVLCNGDRADVEPAAQYTQIEIPRIVCSEDAKAYKPRPEIFGYALEALGVAPDETLCVSDSIRYALEPAARLGIRTAWVNRGGRSSGGFAPDAACGDLGELRRMIK